MIAPLLLGAAFGFLLQRSGLSRYERIVGIYRFRDLAVLQFLLSALVTAAIGIQLLGSLGIARPVPIPATYALGNVAGGVVFGIGMALSGFCPGTVAAGAGEGRLDYLVPGALGLYVGSIVFGLEYERIMPALTRSGRLGAVTLASTLHVEPWLVIVVFAEVVALLFYAITPRGKRRARPSPRADRPRASPARG